MEGLLHDKHDKFKTMIRRKSGVGRESIKKGKHTTNGSKEDTTTTYDVQTKIDQKWEMKMMSTNV